MGLADWFGTFCGNIQVQNGAVISYRYKAVTKRLNTDFWETDSDTAHSLYVGGIVTLIVLGRKGPHGFPFRRPHSHFPIH